MSQRGARRRQSPKAKARRRARAVGLGAGAGALLTFGLGPLAGAPSANADPLTDLFALILEPVASSAVSAINPADSLDAALSAAMGSDGWASALSDVGLSSTAQLDSALAASDTASPAADPASVFGSAAPDAAVRSVGRG